MLLGKLDRCECLACKPNSSGEFAEGIKGLVVLHSAAAIHKSVGFLQKVTQGVLWSRSLLLFACGFLHVADPGAVVAAAPVLWYMHPRVTNPAVGAYAGTVMERQGGKVFSCLI